MNQEIESFIAKYSVRVKVKECPNGSGIFIPLEKHDYVYIITAKHCLYDDNDLFFDNISFDFWNDTDLKLENVQWSLRDDNIIISDDLDVVIIRFEKCQLPATVRHYPTFSITEFPRNKSDFYFRGFPKGGVYLPTNLPCKYSSRTSEYLVLSITSSDLETNETNADDNVEGFSGSGVWFQFNGKLFLTAILIQFNKGIPQFNCIDIQKVVGCLNKNDEFLIDLVDLYKTKLPSTLCRTHNNAERFVLHFSAEYSDFVGRKEELTFLNDFLACEQIAQWTYVTGIGGVGKSRLMLRFAQQLCSNTNEWEVFHSERLSEFKLPKVVNKNSLIIIDDEYITSSQDYEKIIEELADIDDGYKHRLVFVSRLSPKNIEDIFWTKPVISSSFYGSNNNDGLFMKGLDKAEYIDIIKQIAQPNENLKKMGDEFLVSIQTNIDPLLRPLFAILIGRAILENKPIQSWVTADLLNFCYLNEIVKCKGILIDDNSTERHLNLVAILLILKEPSSKQIRAILELNKKWLPSLDSFNENGLRSFFTYKSENETYNSIYPDIMAVFFVLKRFTLIANDTIKYGIIEIESIINWIKTFKTLRKEQNSSQELSQSNMALFEFGSLIIQDFPDDNFTLRFLHKIYDDEIYFNIVTAMLVKSMRFTTDTSKLLSYDKIIYNFQSKHENTILSKYESKFILIRNGIEVEKNYYEIKKGTEEFSVQPWDGDAYFMDISILQKEYTKQSFSKEAAQIETIAMNKGKGGQVIWASLPYIEVQALEVIILNNYKIGTETEVNLFNRLKLLTETESWTDPRMKYVLLRVLFNTNFHRIDDVFKIVNKTVQNLVNTPKQVHRINVPLEVVNSFFLIIRYCHQAEYYVLISHYYSKLYDYILPIDKNNNKENIDATIEFMKQNKLFYEQVVAVNNKSLCGLTFYYSSVLKELFKKHLNLVRPYIIEI